MKCKKNITKFENEKLLVVNSMKKNGGDFIKSLGLALERADFMNSCKIATVWRGEWNKYLEFAKAAKK